ncbi:MAG: hypothetical protein WCT49_04805 [Candidatus Paceibacterota bacterium]|jgi:hypothetical protein|nr:hypothetical protein [Candidatus Paceibacterota bacterium]
MHFEGNGEEFLSPKTNSETQKEEEKAVEPSPVEIPEGKEYIEDVTDAIAHEIAKNEKSWAVMYPEEKDEKIKETVLPLATGVSNEDARLFISSLATKLYHADAAISGPAISFLCGIFSMRTEGAPSDEDRKSEPTSITLSEDQTNERSDWLGYRLKGPITFRAKGSVGRWVGGCMESGDLIIEGNSGYETGNKMTGGKITVEGNTGDWLGHFQEGGEITVLGNAGDFTAKNMKNGVLRVEGTAVSFDKTAFMEENHGSIWYQGKHIWENGKFTEEGQSMKDSGEIP